VVTDRQAGRKSTTGNAAEILSRLSFLSQPRPNGSRALEQAVEGVQAWLQDEGILVQPHVFVLRPYFMEMLGLWLALAGFLLPVAALARWGWVGLLLALVVVAIPLLEVRFLFPTLTALVRRPAQNLEVCFPSAQLGKEVVFCAHLDSKTELLDHPRREALVRLSRPAVVLALGSGLLVGLESVLPAGPVRLATGWLAFAIALPLAVYGVGMGVNLAGGRLSRAPSSGAVDDGAAVAVLLDLARRLNGGDLPLRDTSVTLLFTVGEEAQMQGALAYVRRTYPAEMAEEISNLAVVNLEVVGQNGGYLLWKQDGTSMIRLETDATLNQALEQVVERVAGETPLRGSHINSDAFAFLRQGIAATTLGSYDLELGGRGYHSALDSPDRVDPDRLQETVLVLDRFLRELDTKDSPA
jgi:hypothetical protein